MSLRFETNNILETLFDISIGIKDKEISKRTKGQVSHFPKLAQAGIVIIQFSKDAPRQPRDARGRFLPLKE